MTEEGAGRVQSFEHGSVRGLLQHPANGAPRFGMVLTHGAGTNCDTPLLRAISSAFVEDGFAVLRYDLPFRQRRRTGPPHPSAAVQDRAGLSEAAKALREVSQTPVILAGHSYGGRQASMLAADQPACCQALLLLSYPLHPPAKPEQLRTAHFANVRTPALFVHGSADSFGTEDELRSAVASIPAVTEVSMIAAAGHDLRKGSFDLRALVVQPLTRMLRLVPAASSRNVSR